eukprot:413781-Pleurochrysis_carterae.AAC.1
MAMAPLVIMMAIVMAEGAAMAGTAIARRRKQSRQRRLLPRLPRGQCRKTDQKHKLGLRPWLQRQGERRYGDWRQPDQGDGRRGGGKGATRPMAMNDVDGRHLERLGPVQQYLPRAETHRDSSVMGGGDGGGQWTDRSLSRDWKWQGRSTNSL